MNLDEAMKRISQLEEALMLMVYQYCVTDDRLEHRYMCAGEHAFAALGLENGDSIDKLEEILPCTDIAPFASEKHSHCRLPPSCEK